MWKGLVCLVWDNRLPVEAKFCLLKLAVLSAKAEKVSIESYEFIWIDSNN